jgi:hypothetical protein
MRVRQKSSRFGERRGRIVASICPEQKLTHVVGAGPYPKPLYVSKKKVAVAVTCGVLAPYIAAVRVDSPTSHRINANSKMS